MPLTPPHIHIPTPGDHYSPATGSAIITVIYEMACVHQAHGGNSDVIVSRGTRHDYPLGRCVEVDATHPLAKWQKVADVALGRMGLPRHFGPAAYRPCVQAIDQEAAGPVFIHNGPAAIALLRRRRPRAMLCLWAHNELFNTYGARESRRLADAADRIICCSRYIADDVSRRTGAGPDKVRVVLNGVNTSRFRPATEPQGVPVILFIGRVVPNKGPDLLLRAARKIYGPNRRFKVRIVGSSGFTASAPLSPYEAELRKLAEPISDAVEFQSFVDRAAIPTEYQAASIFCTPSNWNDPAPLIVPEALGCGLPIIASRRGGIPEIGADAVLYFDPPNVDELAAHLARLIDDPDERRLWRQKALNRAPQISWECQYLKLLDALQSDRG